MCYCLSMRGGRPHVVDIVFGRLTLAGVSGGLGFYVRGSLV